MLNASRAHWKDGGPRQLFADGVQAMPNPTEQDANLCVCGHPADVHEGACTFPGCTCEAMSSQEDDDADVDVD